MPSGFSSRFATGGYGPFDEHFPNPFMDVASRNMPLSMRNALHYSEYIFNNAGIYRSALERVVSYFLTDIEFADPEVSDDEQDKWEEFLVEPIDALGNLRRAYVDRMAYGNSFTSLLVPFNRFLACPKCGNSYPLREVYENNVFNFAWSDMQFVASCPHCKTGGGFRGPWRVDDKDDDNDRKVSVKHWSPHEIEILHDYYTDETHYLWRIPEDYKQQVRKGNLYHLERVPEPVLSAIGKNQMFRFHPDVIFHMKEPKLAGMRNRGWGLPRTLVNFRQLYYVQVLRRYNEAIALDYVVPFRLITPAPRPGTGGSGGASQMADPLLSFNMQDFRSQVMSMIRKRRRDPAGWNFLPFPVQYQMLGGDAAKLAPTDLIAQGTDDLLNAVGVPAELYKGTLQLQAAPVALRLFEATHSPLVHEGNAWLRWLARQLSQVMCWELVKPSLRRVTIADDMTRVMAVLQLFSGQQVSGTDALKMIGLDWKQQTKRMGEEQLFAMKEKARLEEEGNELGFAQQLAQGNAAQQQQQALGISQGGGTAGGPGGAGPAPAGGGGGGAAGAQPGMPPDPVDQFMQGQNDQTPQTPEDLVQAADGLAQKLLGTNDADKNKSLRKLKQLHPVLHSLVRARLDAIRRDAKNSGGAQVLAQQFGGGGGQPPGGAPPQ